MLFWRVHIIEDYASFLADFDKNGNLSLFLGYLELFVLPLFLKPRVENFTISVWKNSSLDRENQYININSFR